MGTDQAELLEQCDSIEAAFLDMWDSVEWLYKYKYDSDSPDREDDEDFETLHRQRARLSTIDILSEADLDVVRGELTTLERRIDYRARIEKEKADDYFNNGGGG